MIYDPTERHSAHLIAKITGRNETFEARPPLRLTTEIFKNKHDLTLSLLTKVALRLLVPWGLEVLTC